MSRRSIWGLVLIAPLIGAMVTMPAQPELIVARIVDPEEEMITLHWKNDSGQVIGNLGELERWMHRKGGLLRFAMNGGMYTKEQVPVGLYIEEGRIVQVIDRRTEAHGNFHLQPNGIFGINMDGTAFVRKTGDLQHMRNVRYATQSGPMLVFDGVVNTLFTPGSKNLNIRNGVGLMADGRVLFGISREPMNFHDFATWFKERGCRQALYLDGLVSKAYIPEEAMTGMDGELGILIAVTAMQ